MPDDTRKNMLYATNNSLSCVNFMNTSLWVSEEIWIWLSDQHQARILQREKRPRRYFMPWCWCYLQLVWPIRTQNFCCLQLGVHWLQQLHSADTVLTWNAFPRFSQHYLLRSLPRFPWCQTTLTLWTISFSLFRVWVSTGQSFLLQKNFLHSHLESSTIESIRAPIAAGSGSDKVALLKQRLWWDLRWDGLTTKYLIKEQYMA
jgi:hypothetical protein